LNIKLEINPSDSKNSILELTSVANLRIVLPNCIKENLFIVKVVLVHYEIYTLWTCWKDSKSIHFRLRLKLRFYVSHNSKNAKIVTPNKLIQNECYFQFSICRELLATYCSKITFSFVKKINIIIIFSSQHTLIF